VLASVHTFFHGVGDGLREALTITKVSADRVAYYFSSEGGRTTFLSGSSPATPGTYELGRQSIHE